MRKIINYAIILVSGLVIAFIYMSVNKVAIGDEKFYHYLSNAFFIPGVLIAGLGALTYLSNEGALAGLGYTFKNLFIIIRGQRPSISYSEYKAMKKDNPHSFKALLIVGIVFIILSALMAYIMSRQ